MGVRLVFLICHVIFFVNCLKGLVDGFYRKSWHINTFWYWMLRWDFWNHSQWKQPCGWRTKAQTWSLFSESRCFLSKTLNQYIFCIVWIRCMQYWSKLKKINLSSAKFYTLRNTLCDWERVYSSSLQHCIETSLQRMPGEKHIISWQADDMS